MQHIIEELTALKARVKAFVPAAEQVHVDVQISVEDTLGKHRQFWEYTISARFNNANMLVVGFGLDTEAAFKSFADYMRREAPEYLDQASELRSRAAQAETAWVTS